MTGVQNGPELQLQVRLNVFRADAISPLPTSHLGRLDPPTKLILSAKEPPKATLGLGTAGRPQQCLLAPSGCSPKLLARRAKVFLRDASWALLAGHSGSLLPWNNPPALGANSIASPLNTQQGGTFFPTCMC